MLQFMSLLAVTLIAVGEALIIARMSYHSSQMRKTLHRLSETDTVTRQARHWSGEKS